MSLRASHGAKWPSTPSPSQLAEPLLNLRGKVQVPPMQVSCSLSLSPVPPPPAPCSSSHPPLCWDQALSPSSKHPHWVLQVWTQPGLPGKGRVSLLCLRTSQVVLVVKNLPAKAGDLRDIGSISGSRKIPWRGHMATLSRTLARRIPQTEKPGRLRSIGSQRVGHNWSDLASMPAFGSLPRTQELG